MKVFIAIASFLFSSVVLFGQDVSGRITGTVSYVTTQNVYVKFSSTESIAVGDTLYTSEGGQLLPALVVNNKSSVSCIGNPVGDRQFEVSDEIIAITKKEELPGQEAPVTVPEHPEEESSEVKPGPPAATAGEPAESQSDQYEQKTSGRISASSYSNTSDYGDKHRMRYAFSFRGDHLKNSRFSFENYITFRHTAGEWESVQNDLGHALKIYSLAAKYDFDPGSSLTIGRKINPKISSMGAIDGLQYEKGLGNFVLGALAGSRPDYTNYGYDPSLLQAGAFLSHIAKDFYSQSTLAFVEQHNGNAVDRRFVYLQHSSNPVENLNVFGSFEVDLYENYQGEQKNEPRLTNMYFSLRYRFSRKVTVSASYDNRKNIIYYESYKSFIDRLIEDETRQGLRVGLNIRPVKYVTIGANGSWRFQKSDMNLSKNLNSYLNISRIPGIKARASLTANFLQTGYLDSKIFGIRLSRDIIKGKLDGEVYYRRVDYRYSNSDYTILQNIAGANLSLRLTKKLSLYLYYEGTFDDQDRTFTRINSKIIQRF